MSDLILNPDILKKVKKTCGGNEIMFSFLQKILVSEITKSRYSRYTNEYLELIKQYSSRQEGSNE